MRDDSDVDRALADEFSGYLRSVSREVVQPIRETVDKQKLAISEMIESIGRSKTQLSDLLQTHQKQLSSESASLLEALTGICSDMTEIVGEVSAANEKTRIALLAEAQAIGRATHARLEEQSATVHQMKETLTRSVATSQERADRMIIQTGESIETKMMKSADHRILMMQGQIRTSLTQEIRNGIKLFDAALKTAGSVRPWLIATLLLQSIGIVLLWFRTA